MNGLFGGGAALSAFLLSIWSPLCSGIHCYVGNGTTASTATVMDCNSLGLQREELYCRNITAPSGGVNRNCVAMNWADVQEWEELGCYTTPRGHIRCTCATDFCNAPFGGEGKRIGGGDKAASSSTMTSAMTSALSFVGVATGWSIWSRNTLC